MRGFVIALMVLGASTAVAEPHPRQAEIDKLFAEGRDLITKKNDPVKACEVFFKAYEIDTRGQPGVLLNLGLCNEMQKKYGTSLRWYRRAQAAAGEEKIEDYRAAAEEHSSALIKIASTITIDATGAPDDIVVKVDGEIVNKDSYPLWEIDNGERQVEATAAGKRRFIKTLKITEKSQQTVKIVFEDKQFDVVDRGKTRRKLGIAIGAVGLATLGVSAGLAGYWGRDGGPRDDDPATKPIEGTDERNRRINETATPIAIAGAVVIAAGMVVYLTAPKKERRERTVLLPVIAPDQAGFIVRRGF